MMYRSGDIEQNTHLRIVSLIKDSKILRSVTDVPVKLMNKLKVSFIHPHVMYDQAKVVSINSWSTDNSAA